MFRDALVYRWSPLLLTSDLLELKVLNLAVSRHLKSEGVASIK